MESKARGGPACAQPATGGALRQPGRPSPGVSAPSGCPCNDRVARRVRTAGASRLRRGDVTGDSTTRAGRPGGLAVRLRRAPVAGVTVAVVLAAAVIAALLTTGRHSGEELAVSYDRASRVLDFRGKSFAGEPVDSAALRGTPIVLDFYASWCTVCDRELPDFQRVSERLGGRLHVLCEPAEQRHRCRPGRDGPAGRPDLADARRAAGRAAAPVQHHGRAADHRVHRRGRRRAQGLQRTPDRAAAAGPDRPAARRTGLTCWTRPAHR